MGGEQRRWQRAALAAHGGEHRQGNGQRAAAKAGQVMNGGNTGSRHGDSSFLLDMTIVTRNFLLFKRERCAIIFWKLKMRVWRNWQTRRI